MSEQPTFLFYDYETFGINPALDRPSQFAAIRTDAQFNPIGEPINIYCQLNNDYIPSPDAVLLTGITPQICQQKGMTEAEFAARIHAEFSQPNTCVLGYNSIRFDDEFTRYLFYRNFYDPYEYSYQKGNSRWDLIDVTRACYALRPEGIHWPFTDDGLPSFRLEILTQANHLNHEQAHDALSDVYATIELAKLLKSKQPKLFDYFFQLRLKQNVNALLKKEQNQPLVHVSSMLGGYRNNVSLMLPMLTHPDQPNAIISVDLGKNIDPLFDLSATQLRERLYTKRSDLAENEHPVPIKLIHTNKSPILATMKVLRPEDIQRLSLDMSAMQKNADRLNADHGLIASKLVDLFSHQESRFSSSKDVDQQLYSGFFDAHDKQLMSYIKSTPLNALTSLPENPNDPRFKSLFLRYKARNCPEQLSEQEQRNWQEYRLSKLTPEALQPHLSRLNELLQTFHDDPKKQRILIDLGHYYEALFS